MFKTWSIVALVLALSPLAAPAQEYVIKVKRPGLGDKSKVKSTSNFEVKFKALDNMGIAVIEAEETKTHKLLFTEIGLERAPAGEDLVRLKRQYEHAERTVKGTRETLPYQGKTLLIEKKGGAFEFKIEKDDEILMGKEIQELHEEFNKGDFRKLIAEPFMPRKAVKVNETWTFDVKPLAKAFTADGKIEIDDAKSKGSGKLVKVYQKNGKQFGIIELTIDFPVTQFTGDDGKTSPTKDSKLTIKLQTDTCIDGTLEESKLKGTITGTVSAAINANGMDLTLAISLNATAEEHRQPLKK